MASKRENADVKVARKIRGKDYSLPLGLEPSCSLGDLLRVLPSGATLVVMKKSEVNYSLSVSLPKTGRETSPTQVYAKASTPEDALALAFS